MCSGGCSIVWDSHPIMPWVKCFFECRVLDARAPLCPHPFRLRSLCHCELKKFNEFRYRSRLG